MKKFISSILVLFVAAGLFAGNMESKVRNVPKNISVGAFKNPKENLGKLVENLISESSDESEKVKILHDWICDNIEYDTDLYFSGKNSKQDYVSVLKKKKAVCSGYSALMNEMCRIAGIECVSIKGYSKGFGYTGSLGNKTDHEWNAVKIGHNWELVDVTWDAGFVEYKTWIKSYSTEWFFLEPKYFIYSHLPEQSEFQYLKNPRTKAEFVKEPYVAGKFFRDGFSFGENAPDYKTEISGETEFDFNSKNKYSIIAQVLDEKSGNQIKNGAWVNRTNSKFTIKVDVPSKDTCRVLVFAKKIGEETYPYYFSVFEFEEEIIPNCQKLSEENQISMEDFDSFKKSFFKVRDNDRYYFLDDQFDDARKETVRQVLKKLDISGDIHEPIFEFKIAASFAYGGFGKDVVKFPSTYTSYSLSTGTKLISPVSGTLAKNSTVKFQIESSDFQKLALKVNGELLPFVKNPENGLFELETEITDSENVVVFGNTEGRNYTGLWYYEVK